MKLQSIAIAGIALTVSATWLVCPAGSSKAAETRSVLSTRNVLGLPLRTGKMQLSCPFLKIDATITQSDMHRVVFTSNFKNISITPDPQRVGGISLDFGKDKMKGSIEKGPTQTVLSLDHVGKFTITVTDAKSFVIGGLPFNFYVTFVD